MVKSWGGRRAGSKNVRWTAQMVEDFLDHLAVTCNVKASAAVIGVHFTSVYNKRRNDPDFLKQWEGALLCGYQLLETRLVGHALAGGTTHGELSGDPDEEPICAVYAMQLMALHRAAQAGRIGNGRPRKVATKAETDAVLMKKLAAIESRLKTKA